MRDVYPLVQKLLPDGTAIWEEQGKAKDVLDALRAYDPRCSLARNFAEGAWEIWRKNEDDSQARVGRFVAQFLPEPGQVVASLAAHDTRRGYDPMAAVVAADAARRKARDDAFDDETGDTPDKMHRALVDEMSAHMPAARPIPLSSGRGAST